MDTKLGTKTKKKIINPDQRPSSPTAQSTGGKAEIYALHPVGSKIRK